MKIRIKFEKQGPMKFVGHLDIMRYFQKAIRRADIDIRYSEGFSPHQIMSFAAPLGVGLTSNGEYLDIEVNNTDNSETMIRRLNQAMVEGMKITSYRKLDDKSKNAMSIVAAADYTIAVRAGYQPEDIDLFWKKVIEFCSQPEIQITKKTKKGQKTIDLRPLIYEIRQQEQQLFLKISTGSTDNIKPELILQSYYELSNLVFEPLMFAVQREEVYAAVSEEQPGNFVTLEQLGEEIE